MNVRAFAFAAAMALLGVILLFLYQRKFELEVSGGDKVRVLLAVKTIDRGKPITDDSLSVREVPQAYFEDRMIRETEKAKIIGLRIGNAVRAQQTLMWTDLITAADERRDLSSLIQPGSRAVSIKMGHDDTSLALIRPGDYVDVIGTIAAAGENRSAVVLLQKVLVLATGTDLAADPRDAKRRGEALLTLSATIQEAQLLGLAMERGHLIFALRSPDDAKTSDRLPDLVSTVVTDSKERAQVKGIRGPVRIDGTEP